VKEIVLRITLIGVLVLALGQRGEAQEDQRWSLYETFHGSTNSAGPVFKLDNGVTYGINDHVEVGGGLPVYFVNASSTSTTLASGPQTGIGNAYVDARFKVTGPALFTSTITGTAPTGDKDKGFSTGRATVDWNNYIAVPVLRTPSRIPRFLPDRSRHSVWSVISKVELQYRLLVTSISAVPYMTLRRRANKKLSAS